jgi:hypothetical protein
MFHRFQAEDEAGVAAAREENPEMRLRREGWSGRVVTMAVAGALVFPACGRRKPAEINDIAPAFQVNRSRAPLGSAVEVTYTWKVGPAAKKVPADYRALVHFLDSHRVMLFTDDHVPVPQPSAWEPGKEYSYTRTVFIPIYPYVGEVEVRMGLTPASGRGERVALKGEDTGLREYRVAKMELLPQTENIFLVYKDGWHSPEASPQNPALERTWTKKEALVSFKNPKKDIVLYLEADTNYKAFPQPPVLTVSVGGNSGVRFTIEDSEVFLKKIRIPKDALGEAEWVDLRLAMNQSFVPRALAINQDERELGLLVYHLYVAEADKLGKLPEEGVLVAGPLPPASPAPLAAKTAAGKAPPAKAPGKTAPSPPPKK